MIHHLPAGQPGSQAGGLTTEPRGREGSTPIPGIKGEISTASWGVAAHHRAMDTNTSTLGSGTYLDVGP
eukprot:15464289-Alexandrium_andersonii.AAC.1